MSKGTRGRVLVVEDEETLAESIRYNLEAEGYSVEVVADGATGLARAPQADLVLLDLMLPAMHGLDVLRSLRRRSTVPVVILTAKTAESDRVAGLELGADDYVVKPFSMRELLARVGANLRRVRLEAVEGGEETLEGGDVVLDPSRHQVSVRGVLVDMRPKEFAVLELLMRRSGRLVLRDDLIYEVWGPDYFGDTKTLDVHIKRIRAKVEADPKNPEHIVTVRGLGYKFDR